MKRAILFYLLPENREGTTLWRKDISARKKKKGQ